MFLSTETEFEIKQEKKKNLTSKEFSKLWIESHNIVLWLAKSILRRKMVAQTLYLTSGNVPEMSPYVHAMKQEKWKFQEKNEQK